MNTYPFRTVRNTRSSHCWSCYIPRLSCTKLLQWNKYCHQWNVCVHVMQLLLIITILKSHENIKCRFYVWSDSGGVFDFSSMFIHRVRPLWVATKANVTPNLFSNSVLKSHRNTFQHFTRFGVHVRTLPRQQTHQDRCWTSLRQNWNKCVVKK